MKNWPEVASVAVDVGDGSQGTDGSGPWFVPSPKVPKDGFRAKVV